jgi:Fe-S cluster biogenesis protein NfuA
MTEEEIDHIIEQVLEQIRPTIQMDGGDIEFVKYEDGVVFIRLQGACVGCPASVYTVKLGIEETLKEYVPDVREVVALDDE